MRKRILFIIYSVYGGGAEKQMQYILRHIDRERFEPHLVVFRMTGKEGEVVPVDVPVHDISTPMRPASFFIFFKLVRLIKKLAPDKILSFMWGVNLVSIPAALWAGIKIIACERTFPLKSIEGYSFAGLRKYLISFFYGRADRIVSNSEAVRKSLIKDFGVPREKTAVIPNGIDIEDIIKKSAGHAAGIPAGGFVISAGHMERVKNYGFLIDVMAEVYIRRKIPLVILGEGRERRMLEEKARKLGVEIILPGHVENPYTWIKKAKVFALTSLYEGSPNVIFESMACGTPVVVSDCPGGVRDIVKNGENGILVPAGGKKETAGTILGLLESPDRAESMVRAASIGLRKNDLLEIIGAWEALLQS